MADTTSPAAGSAVRGIRTWLIVAGVITLLAGLAIVIWPGGATEVITIILAIYAIAAGLSYIVAAIVGGTDSGWSRILHAVLGVLFIIAGIVAIMNPASTAAMLAIIVVIFIGISWIMEGVAALSTLGLSASKGWTVFFAIVSIVAGILVMLSPLFAATLLIFWIGFSMIAIGLFGIIRGFMLGRS